LLLATIAKSKMVAYRIVARDQLFQSSKNFGKVSLCLLATIWYATGKTTTAQIFFSDISTVN
jgi:hypothetical protein